MVLSLSRHFIAKFYGFRISEKIPFRSHTTVIGARMSHWKWGETKQHPSRDRSDHQISCSLDSLHFLCDILAPITVLSIYR